MLLSKAPNFNMLRILLYWTNTDTFCKSFYQANICTFFALLYCPEHYALNWLAYKFA